MGQTPSFVLGELLMIIGPCQGQAPHMTIRAHQVMNFSAADASSSLQRESCWAFEVVHYWTFLRTHRNKSSAVS